MKPDYQLYPPLHGRCLTIRNSEVAFLVKLIQGYRSWKNYIGYDDVPVIRFLHAPYDSSQLTWLSDGVFLTNDE